MKYAFAAVALAAVASAQTLADIPKCAIPCLDKSITDNTSCKISDLACVCKNFDAVQGDATACVLKECGSDVAINQVLPAASKLCENPPPASGGEQTSSKAEEPPAQTSSKAEETTKAEEPKPAETSTEAEKPVETPSKPTPAPMPTTSDIVKPPAEKPEPTPVPTAAAAPVSYMGGLAMVVLGALAL